MERSTKHWLIAAGGGDKDSLSNIQKLYRNGRVTKDEYTKALRSYQQYLDEVKVVRGMKLPRQERITNILNEQTTFIYYE